MPEIEISPEHAKDPLNRRVGVLVSVVSILLSVFTIASHRSHTHSVIHRTEANDQWAYYQAKKIRENSSDIAVTLLAALGADADKSASAAQKLSAARDKYAADAKGIMADANAKDAESATEENRALYFDVAEGMLELGLVLCSLFFLSRNHFFPIIGIIASLAGTAVGVMGMLL
jgi:Domain of unknown function (DUF4337)